jgi:hypothetical protein
MKIPFSKFVTVAITPRCFVASLFFIQLYTFHYVLNLGHRGATVKIWKPSGKSPKHINIIICFPNKILIPVSKQYPPRVNDNIGTTCSLVPVFNPSLFILQ